MPTSADPSVVNLRPGRSPWHRRLTRAIAAANREMLATYWAIGNDILARQQEEGWGTRVIDRLSADLR